MGSYGFWICDGGLRIKNPQATRGYRSVIVVFQTANGLKRSCWLRYASSESLLAASARPIQATIPSAASIMSLELSSLGSSTPLTKELTGDSVPQPKAQGPGVSLDEIQF